MARTSIFTRILLSSVLLGGFVIADTGCKKGGSSSKATLTPPATPEYENPFAELNDLPNQINAQVDWVSQPLRDASALGDEFTAIQAKYSIDAKTLGGMASAAFTDGKIEISVDAGISAEAKADVEALLGKIKAAGEAVLTIPKRVPKAAGAISKITLRLPGLGAKATSYLKKQLAEATGEMKASLEANLTAIPEITIKVKGAIPESVTKVKAIPTEAKTTIMELKAAFSGEGAFPKLGTPPNNPEEGAVPAEGEASAEGAAGAETPAAE